MMRAKLRRWVERQLPWLAKGYRRWRDRRVRGRILPYKSVFGFVLHGDMSRAWGCGKADENRAHSPELKVFRDLLGEVDAVADVGANIGLFSLLGAQAGKRVWAFEPSSENYAYLRQNLAENGFSAVNAQPFALGEHPGMAELRGGGEMASLTQGWNHQEATYSERVRVETLDRCVPLVETADRLLLKVDVEGHEWAVLLGAQSLLARPAPTVWLLEHGLTENFPEVNPYFREVFELFWKAGYRAWSVEAGLREVTPADVGRWLDQKARDFGGLSFLFSRPQDSWAVLRNR